MQVQQRRYRRWTVFLAGLCSLLVLMMVLGAVALRKSDELHSELRRTQREYEARQRALHQLSRSTLLISVTIREFLLDTSPENDRLYAQRFVQLQNEIARQIHQLRQLTRLPDSVHVDRLEKENTEYWTSISPVFGWTVEQRQERGTYFLRQEQRPRRQSILKIADEIGRLNTAFYQKQSQSIDESQQEFRSDINTGLGLAFLMGLAIAVASIRRIMWLEQRELEQRVLAERTGDELRTLSTRLRNAQEDERKTLARELHDEVGQKLTAARFGLGRLERLPKSEEPAFSEQLVEVKELVDRSLRVIRNVSGELRPSVLDNLGLGPALQHQARQFAKHTGTPVSVEVTADLTNLPDQHRINLYRIVQESLTNCAKHSGANQVWVTLDGSGSDLVLRIEDDGVGIQPNAERIGGTGLVGIQERVRELGGNVKIGSRPEGGTQIEVLMKMNGMNQGTNQ